MLDMLIPYRLHAAVTSNKVKFNMATIVNFILIVLKIKSEVNNIVPTFVRSYFINCLLKQSFLIQPLCGLYFLMTALALSTKSKVRISK